MVNEILKLRREIQDIKEFFAMNIIQISVKLDLITLVMERLERELNSYTQAINREENENG